MTRAAVRGPDLPFEGAQLRYRSSSDDGVTWSARHLVPISGAELRPIGVSATATGPLLEWSATTEVPFRREVYMAGATGP